MSDRGVSNYFEILGESPRPWLDEDKLKSRFLELSAPLHPDKMVSASDAQKDEAGSRFAAINQAYQVLRSPKDRLHHLLDLTSLKLNDVQKIPPGTMDLFMEIGQVCRDTDAFLELKNKETSPLMKATLFIKGQGWSEKLEVLQQKVSEKRISLESTLKAQNGLRTINQIQLKSKPWKIPTAR